MANTPDCATPAAAPGRRRYRACDVTEHLDMTVIGEVCLGVTLTGYQSVLRGFLDDPSGSLASLLAALDAGDTAALPARAHAVKGGAASLGLRALHNMATRLEAPVEGPSPAEGAAHGAADALALRALIDMARGLLQRMGLL